MFEEEYLLNRAKELSKIVIPFHHYSDPSKDFYESILSEKEEPVKKTIVKLMCENDVFTRNVFSMGFFNNNPYCYFE